MKIKISLKRIRGGYKTKTQVRAGKVGDLFGFAG